MWSFAIEEWSLKQTFSISTRSYDTSDCLVAEVTDHSYTGRGEAQGVDYLGDTGDSMLEQCQQFQSAGLSIAKLNQHFPAGGARNAMDCALWDLTAKQREKTIWDLLDLKPRTLTTVFTIGITGNIEETANQARQASNFGLLKIKLDGNEPIETLEAIRRVRPDATLLADVNQGWSFPELQEYAPHCNRLELALLEQPLSKDRDQELQDYRCPVPLGADESCQTVDDLEGLQGKYDFVNIKLDKTGGLTGALALAKKAREIGLELMVGNNVGTSLSMAPAFVVGQFCKFVDLDGPLLLKRDRPNRLHYDNNNILPFSPDVWG